MHLMLNRLQLRRRLSRSRAVRRAQARPSANSSGVAVRTLVASRIWLREARMSMASWRLLKTVETFSPCQHSLTIINIVTNYDFIMYTQVTGTHFVILTCVYIMKP